MTASRLVPYLVVPDAAEAVRFYTTALGAVETGRRTDAGGRRHIELQVGGSVLIVCDEGAEGPARPAQAVALHLYVPDCDAALARAVAAGATVRQPATNTSWGDRYGRVTDPFGHDWSFAQPPGRAA